MWIKSRFWQRPAPGNLIANGGAESNMAGWLGRGNVDLDDSSPHSGDWSFLMDGAASFKTERRDIDSESVFALTLSFWAKVEDSRKARGRVWTKLANGQTKWKEIVISGTQDWAFHSETFEYPHAVTKVEVRAPLEQKCDVVVKHLVCARWCRCKGSDQ